tara:strand:- start:7423 stop:9693 length:2271 start_codon:yes stop_codon:yes gene_type:complete
MSAQPPKSAAVVLWLVGVAAIGLVALLRWPQGEWLKTDFSALLPADSVSPWQLQANTAAAAAFKNQLVVLVTGESAEAASGFIKVVDETLRSGGYVQARVEETEAGNWRALSERLYPYRWSLLAPSDRVALQHDPAANLEHFRRLLYSPLGGSMASALGSDPAGLYRNFLQAATPAVSLPTGTLVGEATEVALYRVQASAHGPGLYTTYLSLREQGAKRGLTLHATGAPLYSAFGVLSAEREISTIGLVSLLVLVIVLVAILRSLSAILVTLVCVSSGVLAGWVLTVAILQQLHILTLVFGATIIGIAADYAFHYLAHTTVGADGRSTLARVFTGLAAGATTSVLAFIGLTFLPFPGIRQIGVFMAAGLLASFLTVCLLFPVLYRSTAANIRLPAFCTRPQIALPTSWRLLLVVTLLAIPGLFLLEPRAEIRDFYAAPDNLQEDQEAIKHALGRAADSRYLLVRATDTEALLQTEERLREAAKAASGSSNWAQLKGISGLVPSAARQRENLTLLRTLIDGGYLQAHMRTLGFSDTAQQDVLTGFPAGFQVLPLTALEGLRLPLGVGGFLGCDATGCASWLPLPSTESAQTLAEVLDTQSGVVLIDPVADINGLLASYRIAVIKLLGAGSGLISLVLVLLLGWRLALRVMILPVMSCMFSLALCGYTNGHYSIVNLLALLLIVGVSLDYAIFRAFTRTENQPATSLAIALSALTSVLAFGMLSFSSTPLIASFGQTVAFGLVFAYLLSWCRFGAQAQ